MKSKWISDLMDTCGASYCGVQEHFKKIKTLDRYFKSEFPNCDSFVKQAHREEGRDTGRAKGGLAQLAVKNVLVRQQKLVTGGWRVQAQVLHFGEWRLLWVNVYFPTDPRILNFNDNELLEVQAELEAVLQGGGYDACLVGGDFNYDARRNSGFARSMASFLDRVGLVSVWEKFPVDFTYLHTDHKSTSILDNFYVNEALLQYVEAAGVLHLGDNPSSHAPVMLTIRVSDIPRRPLEEKVMVPRRLAWDRAEESEVKKYTATLKEKLEGLEEPECLDCTNTRCNVQGHSEQRDSYLLDIMAHCIETGYSTIPLVPLPRSAKSPPKLPVPGWKEKCKPLSKDAKFWYAVWISANRPTTGELHRVMVSTRLKFRAAVRRSKAELNSSQGRALLQAAESGDKALLHEMRRVMGPKHGVQELPDSLEGGWVRKKSWRSFVNCTLPYTARLGQRGRWQT